MGIWSDMLSGAEGGELTVRQLEPGRLSKPKRFVVIASSCNQFLSKLPGRRAAEQA